MNAPRLSTLVVFLVALVVMPQSPVLAQSPSASQYVDCSTGEAVEGCSAATVGEAVEKIGENTSRGTDALNDAMHSPTASVPGPVSASPGSASASAGITEPREARPTGGRPDDAGGTSEVKGPVGITVLPETGGAPFAALLAGVSLVASGLMVRRIS